jgi:hypothetical protein
MDNCSLGETASPSSLEAFACPPLGGTSATGSLEP